MRSDQNPIVLRPADYSPDMPSYENPGSGNILNAIPRTPISYGPFPSLVAFGDAITAQCLGAIAAEDSGANNFVFCGTTTDLFEYSSATPTNVSQISGGYTLSLGERWRFAQFGQRIVATDFNDNIQSFVIGSSTQFADLSSAAPRARYMAVIDNFLMTANTFDGTDGAQPQRAWWSGLNDPTNWPTPGTNAAAEFQSSFNDLYGDGGWNMGVVGNLGNADGAIFQERAVWRVIYSGPPATFAFLPAEGVRGTEAPNSIVHFGPYAYYLGQDGFYRFDGATSEPIGANRVDKTFFSMVDQNNLGRVDGCVDPINKIVYWAFPSTAATNGNPDYIIAYNWNLDKWALIQVSCETLFFSLGFGYTLDELPGGPLDSIPYPFDSRVWTGGALLLSGFTQDHKLAYFNGPSLEATVDTMEIQPFEGQRAFIQNTRPLVDGGLPTVAMAVRNRLIDISTYGDPSQITDFGTCPLMVDGRYIKAQVKIPAGSTWKHIQGLEIEAIPNGTQ